MSAEDATTVAKWMDAWMMVPKAPGGRLELGRFADNHLFPGTTDILAAESGPGVRGGYGAHRLRHRFRQHTCDLLVVPEA